MKRILLIALLISATAVLAARLVPTDVDKMQDAMEEQEISYVWYTEHLGARITVLGDVNPQDVCNLATAYPNANVVSVVNYGTQVETECATAK